MRKFSDSIMLWLKAEGYTHCFFVAGGGSMHLLDSASKIFTCVPVVHEVSAAIATAYFNESQGSGRAFCLVTTGPGLTNTITGVAGAWLESHELLIIAGQVKTEDLLTPGLRQRGIQEVPGHLITSPISKISTLVKKVISRNQFLFLTRQTCSGRKGPVIIEICIDVSAEFHEQYGSMAIPPKDPTEIQHVDMTQIHTLVSSSKRPIILLGAGVTREGAEKFLSAVSNLFIPIATSWSGADRVSIDYSSYAGRPNTFGMRWSNVFIQQCDLLIAVGARLGLQQTGFNWKAFCPLAQVVMVDIDPFELSKGHPRLTLGIESDADAFLDLLAKSLSSNLNDITEWVDFLGIVKSQLPISLDWPEPSSEYVDPYKFIHFIAEKSKPSDIFTPGTSGGTHTAFYQTFLNKRGQKIISNKGLASMGVGLAGAIGASFANPRSRVISFEGDGSFTQNLQELATVSRHNLNIKMFIINNNGYASIRSSQITYFNGNYVGCDTQSGLGFPNWEKISQAFSLRYVKIRPENAYTSEVLDLFDDLTPTLFEIIADPEQMYLPKISSSIAQDGKMSSNALHNMSPQLDESRCKAVYRYLTADLWRI